MKNKVFYLALPVILVVIIWIFTNVFHPVAVDEYNNGICKECGGHYHLKDYTVNSFLYECDTCENTVLSPIRLK